MLSDEGPSGTGALSGVPAADRALAEGTHAADRDDRDSSVVVAVADRAVLLEGKAHRKAESLLKSTSPAFLRSGQASPSKGATLVAEERVLLEGRMSVRTNGSPFHVPMVLKLTVASDSAEQKEPWTTFSYTSDHTTVAVPCRAIFAVRIHANDANPSFEIEYAAPRTAEVRKKSLEAEGRKSSLPHVPIRMQIWTTSQEQFEEWCTALAPLGR